MEREAQVLPSLSPVHIPGVPGVSGTPLGEADPDTLDALLDSSRRLGVFWPLLDGGPQPGNPASGSITVPDRTRALVAGMAEYGL